MLHRLASANRATGVYRASATTTAPRFYPQMPQMGSIRNA